MSKILKVYNGDYKVSVQDGGNITLDTGNLTGNVIVTGNLEVKGTTTTVESTEVTISDNVILLSEGTVGSGLPSSVNYQSGIEIDRGSAVNAKWVYDEQVSWTLGGLSGVSIPAGTFYAEVGGQKLPINTPGIVAQGNLYVDTGNGVISVTNTSDYEEKVFNYNSGTLEPNASGVVIVDDDHIPNAKAVVDYVNYAFQSSLTPFIREGNTKVEASDEVHTVAGISAISTDGATTVIQTAGPHGFLVTDTVDIFGLNGNGDPIENLNGNGIVIDEIITPTLLRVQVDTTGGDITNYVASSGTIRKVGYSPARVDVEVDGTLTASFFRDRLELDSIKIIDTEISSTASNQDLVLSAPGTGTVKINDVLELPSSPHSDDPALDPIAPADGTKVYSKAEGTGQTGLYYINDNGTSGELISKKRALLLSIIF